MATAVSTMYSETQASASCIWPNAELSMSSGVSLVLVHTTTYFSHIQEENHAARSNSDHTMNSTV